MDENTKRMSEQPGTQNPNADASYGKENTVKEEFRVSGEALTAKLRELLREGNVRRIIIKNEGGKTLLKIPLTVGAVGALLLPMWVALGAIAALAANLTITVHRRPDSPTDIKMAKGDVSSTPPYSSGS